MKKEEYFGTYTKTNGKILKDYIEQLDESVEKYKNYGFPFLKGNYTYEYAKELANKDLNKDPMTPKETFEYMADYFQNVVDFNNPGTMINVIPSVNLVSMATTAYAETFNQNFAQDTYSGNLIAAELEVTKYMSDIIGWNWKKTFGFFTFGGTSTNLYGNKLALVNAAPETSKYGTEKGKYFMVTSKNGHPCHYQLCDWLGIGSDACIEISCLENGEINIEECKKVIEENIKKGKIFLGFNLNGGSTNEMTIDPVKKIYDYNKELVKKFSLNYTPHIHIDSVLGWVYLFFNGYDFNANELNLDKKYINVIKKLNKKISEIKYANSIGIDFHKTGFCPYVTSMIMVKNYETFYKLNPDKKISIDELKYGNYNPYLTALEYSRSCHGPIAALSNLKSLGINGIRKFYSEIVESAHYFRYRLSQNKNVTIIFKESLGNATMFIIKPKNMKKITQKDLYEASEETINKIKEFNIGFGKNILNKAINNQISFFFTSSRSYTLPNSNIKVGTLKAYPMSVFLTKQEVDRIIDELNQEIETYIEQNVITTGIEYFQDMSKDINKDKE